MRRGHGHDAAGGVRAPGAAGSGRRPGRRRRGQRAVLRAPLPLRRRAAGHFLRRLPGRPRAASAAIRALVLAGVLASAVFQCLYDPKLGAPDNRADGGGQRRVRRGRHPGPPPGCPGSRAAPPDRATAGASGSRPPRWPSPRSGPGSPRTSAASCNERIDEIGHLARPAGDGTGQLDASFAAIELAGRAILDSMRHVVGTLRDPPTEPEPGLAELGSLLTRATTAATRLSVEGPARPLPASLELTGYRIVEQLLTALRDEPSAQVDVRLRFAPDCLELRVAGPPPPTAICDSSGRRCKPGSRCSAGRSTSMTLPDSAQPGSGYRWSPAMPRLTAARRARRCARSGGCRARAGGDHLDRAGWAAAALADRGRARRRRRGRVRPAHVAGARCPGHIRRLRDSGAVRWLPPAQFQPGHHRRDDRDRHRRARAVLHARRLRRAYPDRSPGWPS